METISSDLLADCKVIWYHVGNPVSALKRFGSLPDSMIIT